jgi:hypothetical protein
MAFVDWWKTISSDPCQSLFSFVKLRSRELRRGWKERAGTLFGAIVVGGLLLAFAGCGGDGGGSNVPEVGGASTGGAA